MNPFFGDSRRQQPYITFRRTPTYILVHNYMKSTLRNLRQVGAHLYDVVRSQDCRVAVSCNLLVVACFFVLLLVLLFFFFFRGIFANVGYGSLWLGALPYFLLFPGTLGTLGFQGYLLMAVSHGFQIESHVVAMLGISNIAS